MAAMFTRMAEEASMVAEHREEQEARDADPDSIDTEKMLTEKAAKGQGEEGEGAAPKPQEDDGGNDEEFQKLQVSSQAQSTAAAASTAAKSRAASAGSSSLTFFLSLPVALRAHSSISWRCSTTTSSTTWSRARPI